MLTKLRPGPAQDCLPLLLQTLRVVPDLWEDHLSFLRLILADLDSVLGRKQCLPHPACLEVVGPIVTAPEKLPPAQRYLDSHPPLVRPPGPYQRNLSLVATLGEYCVRQPDHSAVGRLRAHAADWYGNGDWERTGIVENGMYSVRMIGLRASSSDIKMGALAWP